jgi:hypothetical protein
MKLGMSLCLSHDSKELMFMSISQTSWYMGFIAETTRRFFHPSAADEMLKTFVPLINPMSLSVSLSLNIMLSWC